MTNHSIGSKDEITPIPITVGIGASAGGHEALEQIFTSLPLDSGFSYIVVMHLPQDGPSLLAGLLGRFTAMQVLTIEDGMPLQPNTIHVPPPGKDLKVCGGRFRFQSIEEKDRPHHSIDSFFASLADDLGRSAIAVVLSGFGSDGSEGVKKIKEKGGIVLIQDPKTATNPFMPQNAIATGAVDAVLPVKGIAERLAQIAEGNDALQPSPFLDTTNDKDLHDLLTLLKRKTGHDFSSYKRKTLLRRIERRMVVNRIKELSEYLIVLDKNPEEARALSQEFLIGVTNFFRDPQAFELLQNKIIPCLFANRKTEEPLRIWHACCATGEEAYSVAMLLLEHLEKEDLQAKVQIFATDLDEVAVAQARAGLYTDDLVSEVSEERLKCFFTKTEGRWQVTKQLREMIVFAHHNIIKDPPFSRLDLLVCRNFLIYLNPDFQKLLIPLFHQVLNPGGFLFLGPAETVGLHSDLFTPIDAVWKIFMRQGGKTRVDMLLPFSGPVRRLADMEHAARSSEAQETDKFALADKLLLERYVPARVLINEKHEVVHFSSRAGEYLLTPEGKPTKDLLKIARIELRPALRAAIYKAFTDQQEIVYRGIKVLANTGETTVDIIVVPLVKPPPAGNLALVIIETTSPSSIQSTPSEADSGKDTSKNSLTRHLEEQLRVTGEQLQSTSEQLETSNERFLLANEELMTVNEELQSTNEELQSTNEELVTVNSELQRKMEELNQSNSDLQNLFTSSEIATIILNRQLLIKRFSPAMAAILNLLPADTDRSVHHLNSNIDWSNLEIDATSVLEKLITIEREVDTRDGRSYIMRVLPYRTTQGVVDGIVVTLIDISERKRAEKAQYASEKAFREGDERLRFALETCHIGAWDLNLADHTAYQSPEHTRIFGYQEMPQQWTLEMFIEHIVPEDRSRVSEIIRQGIAMQSGWSFECRMQRTDGQIRWIWAGGRPNFNTADGGRRVAGVVQDITERKEAEEEFRKLSEIVQQERDRLSALINSIGDEVWFADTEKKFTLANPSALRMFGFDGMSEIDIEKLVTSLEVFRLDGSPRPLEEAPPLRALQGEVVKNVEEIIRNPVNNESRYREVSANPVRDAHGNIIGSVSVVRDITERKQGEEALRLYEMLSKNSRDIILFIRCADGRILEANAAALQTYGFNHEEILSMTIKDLRTPDTLQLTAAQMLEAIKEGVLFETKHRRKDGTTFPVEVRSQRGLIGDTQMLVSVVRDITERRLAEDALRENRAQLDAALASMTDAVFISDRTGHFIEFNDAFATFHKFENKAVCLKTLSEYPDILEVYMANGELAPLEMWAVPRALRGETITNAEYTLRRKDTGETWVGSYSFSPIYDAEGAIVGSVVVGRDITDLKHKEDALRQSELQYRTLFDTLIEGFCTIEMIFDSEGRPVDYRFLETNPAFEKQTGLYNVQGKLMRDLVPEHEKHWFEIYGKVALTGESVQFENEAKALGRYYDVCAYRIGGSESRKVAILFNDITDRKRSEEALRLSEERRSLALEAAQAGTWEWDLETNKNIWSDELWQLYGLEKFGCDPSFDEWQKIVHPDDLSKTEQVIQNAVLQSTNFSTEWRLKPINDEPARWLMSRGRPLIDVHGRATRYLGTVIDVTERKQTEEANKDLHTQLVHAQKMEAIGTLAGGIAHDFNNILGAVIGYSEIVRDDALAKSVSVKDVDQILKAGQRAKELVQQILAFSRQAQTHQAPVKPNVIITEAIKLLRASLPATIFIEQDIDADIGNIVADPIQIHQIVMNLCTNSFHAMEMEGGILTISLKKKVLRDADLTDKPHLQAGQFLLLSIKDTGVGIAPDIREKIFNPYFTTKEVGKGTGMGLAIVHGFVQSLGGSIALESRVGEGTLVSILLPVVETTTSQGHGSVDLIPSGKEHILFVDDEEILNDMGKIMLERLGYRVTARKNSSEALATFQKQPDAFDLVITDMTMPGMTGIDLARRVRQIRPEMPIILCTGYSSLISEEKARSLGIKGFAMKPITKKDISTLIRDVLEKNKNVD